MKKFVVTAVAAALLAACVPQSQYHWGSYSRALYDYYGDATKAGEYRAALVAIVEDPENQARIPPGIFAELGYMELQAGNDAEAKKYFQMEKARWPESATFMDRMIASIGRPDTVKDGRKMPDGAGPTDTVAPKAGS